MDKCIFCRRCESVCNDVQTVGALGAIRRGFNTTIAPAFDKMMTDSECTYCGQCVAVCPVGALTERDHTNRLIEDLSNPDKIVIVQTAPAVRAALGEEFGLPAEHWLPERWFMPCANSALIMYSILTLPPISPLWKKALKYSTDSRAT